MCHFLLVSHLGIAFLGRGEGQNITIQHVERFPDAYILRIRIMTIQHYERYTDPYILRIRIMAMLHMILNGIFTNQNPSHKLL